MDDINAMPYSLPSRPGLPDTPGTSETVDRERELPDGTTVYQPEGDLSKEDLDMSLISYTEFRKLILTPDPDFTAQSFPTELPMKLRKSVDSFYDVDRTISVNFSCLPKKKTTSMYYMSVPLVTGHVSAVGDKQQSFPKMKCPRYADVLSYPFFVAVTGCKFSYISCFEQGFRRHTFGLEEENLGLRARVIICNPTGLKKGRLVEGENGGIRCTLCSGRGNGSMSGENF